MKRLILIRHGETDYTLQRRYCGQKNIPLNTNGIGQAQRLRQKLKSIEIDKIYSSDLRRAVQTAKIVFKNEVIIKKKGLREIDFGKFYGLTFEEASRVYPDVYRTWIDDPANVKIPGGESFLKFADRVRRCFKEIFNESAEKTAAIVSHGGVTRIILLKISGQGFDKFWDIEQDTAALNEIEFNDGAIKVLKINDVPCF